MSQIVNRLKKALAIFGITISRVPKTEAMDCVKSINLPDVQFKWIADTKFNTVIDIGANIGQFALKMRSLLPDAMIHSFEPIPSVFGELVYNFKDDTCFTPYNYALGITEEKQVIYLNEYSPSSSILEMENEHKKHFDYARQATPVDITVTTLDNIFKDKAVAGPVLIKIDVQGYEDKVIAGGLKTLDLCSVIIIEVSFKELYHGQPMFDDIYSTLRSLGFKYSGNYEQLLSPQDGEILQSDAIFVKRS